MFPHIFPPFLIFSKQVLKKARIHGGLKKGLHECAKALDRRSARLCCLAKDCENDEYKKLIKGLCAEGEVHVVMVEAGKDLGAWCGLAKLDDDGSVKKAVRTNFRNGATQVKFMAGGGCASAFDPIHITEGTFDEMKAACDGKLDTYYVVMFMLLPAV